jgi:hypothetical protein
MSNRQASLCNTLKSTLLEFISDLKDNVLSSDEEKNDAIYVKLFFDGMKPEEIMKRFVDLALPHRDKLVARNDAFFVSESSVLFKEIPAAKVKLFKSKWLVIRKNKEHLDTIWQYFDSMIAAVEKHEKCK